MASFKWFYSSIFSPNLQKYATTLNKQTNPFCWPLISQTNAAVPQAEGRWTTAVCFNSTAPHAFDGYSTNFEWGESRDNVDRPWCCGFLKIRSPLSGKRDSCVFRVAASFSRLSYSTTGRSTLLECRTRHKGSALVPV